MPLGPADHVFLAAPVHEREPPPRAGRGRVERHDLVGERATSIEVIARACEWTVNRACSADDGRRIPVESGVGRSSADAWRHRPITQVHGRTAAVAGDSEQVEREFS
jgi:hypothetical protein